MGKDAFYFPHYCNARHDRKVKRVRKELGPEGYGIFFMLLEVLREQTDYRFPMEDIDLIADEFGSSEQKVRTVICNYDLFSVDEDEHFFSSNLILYLQPYFEGKEKKRIAGIKGNLIKYGHYTSEQLKGKQNGEIIALANDIGSFSQCDPLPSAHRSLKLAKESKINKINKIKLNDNTISAKGELIEYFNSVWKLYPNKKGKDNIERSTAKLKEIKKISFELWQELINRYIEDKPDYQAYMNGSTFFNGGYKDYLEENFEPTPKQQKPKYQNYKPNYDQNKWKSQGEPIVF